MRNIFGLMGWLCLVFTTAWFGSRYMPGDWYAGLVKPPWNPPNSIFAPVWSALYLLMGVAAWIVWRRVGFSGAGVALGLFVAQLALNALWSYLFFGRQRPDLAFFDILPLWSLILIVTVLFWRVSRLAGALMFPYVAWVGFASYLNFVLWRLNSQA